MAELVWSHDHNGIWESTEHNSYWFGHVFSEYEPAVFDNITDLREFMHEMEKQIANDRRS